MNNLIFANYSLRFLEELERGTNTNTRKCVFDRSTHNNANLSNVLDNFHFSITSCVNGSQLECANNIFTNVKNIFNKHLNDASTDTHHIKFEKNEIEFGNFNLIREIGKANIFCELYENICYKIYVQFLLRENYRYRPAIEFSASFYVFNNSYRVTNNYFLSNSAHVKKCINSYNYVTFCNYDGDSENYVPLDVTKNKEYGLNEGVSSNELSMREHMKDDIKCVAFEFFSQKKIASFINFMPSLFFECEYKLSSAESITVSHDKQKNMIIVRYLIDNVSYFYAFKYEFVTKIIEIGNNGFYDCGFITCV